MSNIDKSLARGTIETLIRDSRRSMKERKSEFRHRIEGLSPVHDERSAKRLYSYLCELYMDRSIILRYELNGSQSSVFALGFDIVETGGRNEIVSFHIRGNRGRTSLDYLGIKVSRHAAQRFLQREAGVSADLKLLVSEFGPALLSSIFDKVLESGTATEEFLPTTTGAALMTKDPDEDAAFPFVAATWIRTNQLRPEQSGRRLDALYNSGLLMRSLVEPSIGGNRAERRAGRKAKVGGLFNEEMCKVIGKVMTDREALEPEAAS